MRCVYSSRGLRICPRCAWPKATITSWLSKWRVQKQCDACGYIWETKSLKAERENRATETTVTNLSVPGAVLAFPKQEDDPEPSIVYAPKHPAAPGGGSMAEVETEEEVA